MGLAPVEIPMPSQGQVLGLGVIRLGETLPISIVHSQASGGDQLLSDSSGSDFWGAEPRL